MAIVDKKTPRLGLLLPNADNFLQDDVERLIQSFDLLDVLVVMRDQTTGKIADDQLSEVIARLDAQGKIATSALPSSVVQKGADGKIDASVLPSIAIIDSFPVPNEASMLGLQCERGDIAIRTDLGRSFILTDLPPSKLSNWRELTSTNVTSVNGQVGAITGLAKAGVNDDITQLTALSGPLRLGGEAAGDYDAVTLKQLRAASGGAGGASMNGVMNNFIGAVEWFNGTRAKLPAGYLQADGQIVLRSLVPDIVAAMQAGMLNVIEASGSNNSDAMWQMTPTGRGRYSWGDGDATTGTTIRLPDLNGVWVHPTNSELNSIPGLFLRGDGMIGKGTGGNETGGIGVIRRSAAPNITGQLVAAFGSSTSLWDQGTGAFTLEGPTLSQVHNANSDATAGAPRGSIVSFTASNANPIYGNNGATEVRPASVQGIWIIRASGGFVAANTSWSVINADATRPSAGTIVDGGEILSKYNVGTATEAQMSWRMRAEIGATYYARLNVSNTTTGKTAVYDFNENGDFTLPGQLTAKGNATIAGSVTVIDGQYPQLSMRPNYIGGGTVPNTVVGGAMFFEGALDANGRKYYRLFFRRKDGNRTGEITLDFPTSTSGTLALQGTSGLEYKKDITDADAQEAMDRINGQRLVNFVYKDDEQERVRFGVIAEEAELIAPQYIKHNQVSYEDILDEEGNKIGEKTKDRPSVDVNPIVMDLMGCVQALTKRIEAMEAEIAELKASK